MSRASQTSVWTPANIVTIIRVCLVPVFVVALLSPWPEWFGIHSIISNQAKSLLAAAVFILISCTDWVDGYLARSRNEVTDFGKLMDPLADKILVAAALLALIELQVLPSWPVLIILAREFIVSGVRMLAASRGIIIAASWYGKAKTVFQIFAIILFLVKDSVFAPQANTGINPLYLVSWAVMVVALLLTILSMVDYLSKVWPLIFPGKRAQNTERAQAPSTQVNNAELEGAAQRVITLATQHNCTISTAESLTGGMISTYLTSVPGSSQVFLGSVVSYALSVKEHALGVSGSLLAEQGAVNGQTAIQMARGAARVTASNLAVSVTGIAGPAGEEPGKPVGTVFIGFYTSGEEGFEEAHFQGTREEVRMQTVMRALTIMEQLLASRS